MPIKAIETRYNGYHFRSRLEARWAVFFDTAGIMYSYEPQGFDLDGLYYLPDFWLPEMQSWAEVKPGSYRCGWYDWNSSLLKYQPFADPRNPYMPDSFYDAMTKARRLVDASGFSLFMLFEDFMPLTCDHEYRILGSNKAWHPNNRHEDGCCEFAECPLCCKIGFSTHGQHDICECLCEHPFSKPRRHGDWGWCPNCGALSHTSVWPNPVSPHRPWMRSGSQKLLNAYTAARSARFEHGSHGRLS